MRKYNQKQARVAILKEMHDYIMNIDVKHTVPCGPAVWI